MTSVLEDSARRAAAYLDALSERQVRPLPEAVAALEAMRHALPESGQDPAEVIA
jgi:hypothetical protein